MRYSEMIKKGVESIDLLLAQICRRLSNKGVPLDKAVLSKIQNAKLPPARDEVNVALAEILKLDTRELRLAAVKEILSEEIIQLIKEAG